MKGAFAVELHDGEDHRRRRQHADCSDVGAGLQTRPLLPRSLQTGQWLGRTTVSAEQPIRQKQPAEGEAERDRQDQRREDVGVEQGVEQIRRRRRSGSAPALPGGAVNSPTISPISPTSAPGMVTSVRITLLTRLMLAISASSEPGKPDEVIGFLAHELVDQPRQRPRLAVDPGRARLRPQIQVGVREQARSAPSRAGPAASAGACGSARSGRPRRRRSAPGATMISAR